MSKKKNTCELFAEGVADMINSDREESEKNCRTCQYEGDSIARCMSCLTANTIGEGLFYWKEKELDPTDDLDCNTCKCEDLGAFDEPCSKCIGDVNYWEPKPQTDAPLTRADFLKVAESIVCHDRNDTHGEPEDNFGIIAKLWSVYLNTEIKSADVAVMMCLFKIARMQTGKMDNADSWTDLIGYAACGAECAMKSGERNATE